MKCPKCGEELVQSKKNPEYWLCFQCKQKYKKKRQTYSNIPAKEVREAGEAKVKKRYSEMLDAEEQANKKRGKKASKKEIDNYDDGGSVVPLVILGILIIIVAALIAYMYFK